MVKYCTADEVGMHNHTHSLWVSLYGNVLDLTDLIAKHSGDETRAILDVAGQDISHWFEQKEDGQVELKTHIHPITLLPAPFIPLPHRRRHPNVHNHKSDDGNNTSGDDNGHDNDNNDTDNNNKNNNTNGSSNNERGDSDKILHVPPPFPRTDYMTDFGDPWWKDSNLVIAHLTAFPRRIKITNTLTSQEHILDVCGEESLEDIKNRYLEYNKHASSYSWKRLGIALDMKKTLDENGIKDDSKEGHKLNYDDDFYIPAIHLYFVDDLTID